MAIWKEQAPSKIDSAAPAPSTSARPDEQAPVTPAESHAAPQRASRPAAKESLIATELTIEGKIEGGGDIRLAGHFKGDITIEGNLTIEPGAKVTGTVRARTVVIGGELEGNIDAASHVELLQSGAVNGDLRAGSLVVAGGSRMRGNVSFGWDDGVSSARSSMSSAPMKKMEIVSSA